MTSFSQRDNKPYEANIQLSDGTAASVQFDKLVITAGGDSGQVLKEVFNNINIVRLKVLSSEMDPVKIRLIRKIFIKGSVAPGF